MQTIREVEEPNGEGTPPASPVPPASEPAGTGGVEPVGPAQAASAPPLTHTRTSAFWGAVVVGLVVLLVLLVFILENGQRASISFFGAHGHLPQGVALLLSAVIGGLFVVLAGVARILQLRSRARGHTKSHRLRRHRPDDVAAGAGPPGAGRP